MYSRIVQDLTAPRSWRHSIGEGVQIEHVGSCEQELAEMEIPLAGIALHEVAESITGCDARQRSF